MINIKIKRLTDSAKIPTKAHNSDACFDIYLDSPNEEYISITPGETKILHKGFATEIPQGYFAAIFPRSGLGIKYNLRLPNGTGIIDADYRGEWKIALFNDSKSEQILQHHDRVSQVAILPVLETIFEEVEALDHTER